MKSYFRTQWFNIAVGLANFVMSIYHFVRRDDLWSVAWLVTACVWFIMSRVDYNHDRIEALEKKAEKYDAVCELAKALADANKIDREHDRLQDNRFKLLEDELEELKK